MMNSAAGINMRQMSMLQASMQTMLTADSALNKAQIQGSVINRMNGRANVLESEIKSGNGNIEAKEEELAEVRQDALDVAAEQADMLGEAQHAMKKAYEADMDQYEGSTAASISEAEQKETGAGTDISGEDSADAQGAAIVMPENAGENVYTSAGQTVMQSGAPKISLVA